MGSFTFKWDKPADEVYVTGTFDEWSKSQQLEKVGDSFEKTVDFPEMSEKIFYKFVVDGEWITDDSIPTEKDLTGNYNNILTPEQLAKEPPPTTAIMSNVTPDATTVQLAAAVPLEEKKEVPTPTETAIMSNVAPDATTAQLAAAVPLEEKKEVPTTTEAATEKTDEFKAEANKVTEEEKPELSEKAAAAEETTAEKMEESKPDIPTPVAPGGFPETPANDIQPDVPTPVAPGGFPETPSNDLDQPVSINPMPAADNAINPITLAPGEKVPDSVVAEDVDKNVKLDKESYEKADELPGEVSAAQVPPITETMIPESSLPITGAKDVTVSSAAPDATTAILAADAPIETKQEETTEVPDVVKESQEKAGVEPEASANPEEVKEKAEVEAELLDKVPEAPSAAEGTAGEDTDKKEGETTAPDAAPTVAAAPVTATVADKDAEVEEVTGAATELPDSAKEAAPPAPVTEVVDAKATEEAREEAPPEVPVEVKQSSAEASTSPEATANTEAAAEKKEVEKAAPIEPKAEETAKTDEAPTPAAAKPAEEVPRTEEAKPAEETAKAAVNGTEAPAAESSSAPSTTGKKKNRLSVLLSKLKQKLKH